MNRREFMTNSLMAGVGASVARGAFAAQSRPGDRIAVGLIGSGARGQELLQAAAKLPGVEFVGVCDAYKGRAERARARTNGKATSFNDYRQILDSKDAGYHDTGAFYDLVKPTKNAMKPVGELNHVVITCNDTLIDVELNGEVVSRTNARNLYWNLAQQIAHLTSNGATLRTGDLLASGTISGAGEKERGSLIELTWNEGPFLQDGDEIVLRGEGLGEVRGRIV